MSTGSITGGRQVDSPVPETASGPMMLAPQARTAVAPETGSGPPSWAPSMSSAP
jgi:hypothetical protein